MEELLGAVAVKVLLFLAELALLEIARLIARRRGDQDVPAMA